MASGFLESYMSSDIPREITNLINEFLLLFFLNKPPDLHYI
jgi:hypothetical protein